MGLKMTLKELKEKYEMKKAEPVRAALALFC
jgi:hypothetical protein